MSLSNTFVSLSLCFVLGACSLYPRPVPDPIDPDQTRLVAQDFVNALSKLRGYSPRNTTVQLRPSSAKFADSLERALRNAGYGLQLIPSNDTGTFLVTYESESYENISGKSIGYRLRVGSVELAREYEIRAGRVFPMTGLSVKGVAISSEPLDGTIFDRNRFTEDESSQTDRITGLSAELPQPGNQSSGQRPLLNNSSTEQQPIITVGPGTGQTKYRPTDQAPVDISTGQSEDAIVHNELSAGHQDRRHSPLAETERQGFSERVMMHMLRRGDSGGDRVFKQYRVVSQVVLDFPNDSTVLGRANKKTIYKNAALFDPDTDVMSIVGCSHGKTEITNGNAFLSNGRANRVKEELIFANVPPHLIVDEGCWSDTPQEGHPGKGVMLMHRRQSNAVRAPENSNG